MSTCPSCFTERSAVGGCFCEDPPALVVKGPVKFTSDVETKKDDVILKTPLPKTMTFEMEIEHVDEELAALLLNEPMSDAAIIRTARSLLDEHGLVNVRIAWMNAINKLGECRYNYLNQPVELRFSRKMFKHMSYEEQMNTITHEVAHALTPGHHHDYIWASKHRELGGNGLERSRLTEEVHEATKKWVGTCPNGHKMYRAQRSDKMYHVSCAQCAPYFDPNYLFEWKAQW